MKALAIVQRVCFSVHIASLVFGLAGLLLVLPNPAFIAQLPESRPAGIPVVNGWRRRSVYDLWRDRRFYLRLSQLRLVAMAELFATGSGRLYGRRTAGH